MVCVLAVFLVERVWFVLFMVFSCVVYVVLHFRVENVVFRLLWDRISIGLSGCGWFVLVGLISEFGYLQLVFAVRVFVCWDN